RLRTSSDAEGPLRHQRRETAHGAVGTSAWAAADGQMGIVFDGASSILGACAGSYGTLSLVASTNGEVSGRAMGASGKRPKNLLARPARRDGSLGLGFRTASHYNGTSLGHGVGYLFS